VFNRPVKPGHPTSLARVSNAFCNPDLLEKVEDEKSFEGERRDGAGHPVTSLQRKAKA
jgi:hypothetical protein